jgi:hypothetical protein
MGHISKYVYRALVCGISSAGLFVAHPTLAAGSFDGSYSGTSEVTYGTEPVCGSGGPVTIAVKDGEIRYGYGAFPLKLEVAPDGTFTGSARKGNRGGGQRMRAKGRITNAALEAKFNANGMHGRVCSYHWSLKKE